MWFRGMHYSCWGQEDGGEELQIETNGGVLWGRPRPGRGCRAIDGWVWTCAEPSSEIGIGLSPSQKMLRRVWKYQNICSLATKMSVNTLLRLETARLRLSFCGREWETFLCWFFTNYGMWAHSYEPDLKIRQGCEWCHQCSPHLCKYQQEQGQMEVMFSVDYDCKGFLLHLLSLLFLLFQLTHTCTHFKNTNSH
jgi:hypothetical protein